MGGFESKEYIYVENPYKYIPNKYMIHISTKKVKCCVYNCDKSHIFIEYYCTYCDQTYIITNCKSKV